MKRILLISYNYYPELAGIGKYNGEMMDWLVNKGYDCTVLTAYPYYPDWKVHDRYSGRRFLFSSEEQVGNNGAGCLTIYRCPMYIPNKPTSSKRILLEVSFFISAFVRLLGLLTAKRFDTVIAVAPAFHAGILGLFYKFVRGSRLLYHLQDFQIEAARELKMIRSQLLIRAMLSVEDLILREASFVSTISSQMLKKVENRGARNAFLFPNWTNTDQFYPIADRNSIKKDFGFSEYDKVIMYSGAIGEKQGLESILYAAHQNRENKDLKFIICGSGPYKRALEQRSRELGLVNLCFLPLQPLKEFNRFLNMADLHLIIQKSWASDLVMPSKLGAILAIGGVALVTANPGTSLHSLIQKHNIGFLIESDNQDALNKAIRDLTTGEFFHTRENARRYAVDYLSIERVMCDFENTLTGELSPDRLQNISAKEFAS